MENRRCNGNLNMYILRDDPSTVYIVFVYTFFWPRAVKECVSRCLLGSSRKKIAKKDINKRKKIAYQAGLVL